jgi:hypothetical protein
MSVAIPKVTKEALKQVYDVYEPEELFMKGWY